MAELYAILDWPHAAGLGAVEAARGLLGARPDGPGPALLQLRCKGADTSTRIALIRQVGPVCRAAGVPLLVNDDLAAALACPGLASGVHFGQGDLAALGEDLSALRRRTPAGFRVGVSTHDREQVRASAAWPVDYIGFGPVLPTRSKALPEPCVGLDGLAEACRVSAHPVVAIGGLGADEALAAARAGAAMVAMIGALVAPTAAEIRGRVAALAASLMNVHLHA
jgi:thiamine-phosphate pyrophosphorylase